MRMLVCIKQVPESSQVEVDENGVLQRSGVDSKMNPYDLYALETAIRLREVLGGTVGVVTMGPPQAQSIIREAYMLGADEGFLFSDQRFAGADVLATAYTISQGIKSIGCPKLIVCGKQTTDGDTAQVGPSLAEYLGIPHAAWVKKIANADASGITVEIDMGSSIEVASMEYPCLITVKKDIYQPRLPSFRKKLAAADREIKMFSFADFADQNEANYGLKGSATQVEQIFSPEKLGQNEQWQGDGTELADKLLAKLTELKYYRGGM